MFPLVHPPLAVFAVGLARIVRRALRARGCAASLPTLFASSPGPGRAAVSCSQAGAGGPADMLLFGFAFWGSQGPADLRPRNLTLRHLVYPGGPASMPDRIGNPPGVLPPGGLAARLSTRGPHRTGTTPLRRGGPPPARRTGVSRLAPAGGCPSSPSLPPSPCGDPAGTSIAKRRNAHWSVVFRHSLLDRVRAVSLRDGVTFSGHDKCPRAVYGRRSWLRPGRRADSGRLRLKTTFAADRPTSALPARIAPLACRRGERAANRGDWRPHFKYNLRLRAVQAEGTLDSVQTWDRARAGNTCISSKTSTW